MFCPNCGDANPDEAKFCGKCGRPMPAAAAAEPPKTNPTSRAFAAVGATTQQTTTHAVSDGLKWSVAIGSALIPVIGLVMGIIYLNDANPEKKAVAKVWFIAAAIGFLFYMLIQCSESGNY